MFPTLRLEVMDRFTAVEQYFRASRSFRGDLSQTAKGLAFVQVYAIHEYTVKNVVRIAIDEIAAHSHKYADLRPSLLTLFLDPQLRSLRDCDPKNVWENRLKLLDRSTSEGSVLSVDVLPGDNTHFRHTQIKLILRVFGVTRAPTVRRRHLYRIDEVVNNRNFIAHGLETPVDVGRRYSRQDITRVIRQMKGVSLRLISLIAEHCGDPKKHCR